MKFLKISGGIRCVIYEGIPKGFFEAIIEKKSLLILGGNVY